MDIQIDKDVLLNQPEQLQETEYMIVVRASFSESMIESHMEKIAKGKAFYIGFAFL